MSYISAVMVKLVVKGIYIKINSFFASPLSRQNVILIEAGYPLNLY